MHRNSSITSKRHAGLTARETLSATGSKKSSHGKEVNRMENMEQVVSVMGIQVRRSAYQESRSYKQHSPDCDYLRRGWCKSCTCDQCRNGYITRQENGMLISRKCSCMGTAYSRHLLEVCGLDKLAERFVFWTKMAKKSQANIRTNR